MTQLCLRHRAFGLDIVSDFEIPQLPRLAASHEPSCPPLRIERGSVEDSPVTIPGRRRGHARDVFRYEVVAGCHATIDCLQGADPRDVADLIVSRVLAVVMYQRGMLPIHASAVRMGKGIVAFGGETGAGKSTLAAALAQRGHTVISDDMLAVQARAEQMPQAWPGARRLKLSQPVLDYLGPGIDGKALSNTQEGKYLFGPAELCRPAEAALWRDGLPLVGLVTIRRGGLGVKTLRRLDAIAAWPLLVRSADLVPVASDPAAIWEQWLNVVARVKLVELTCSKEYAALPETVACLESCFAGEA